MAFSTSWGHIAPATRGDTVRCRRRRLPLRRHPGTGNRFVARARPPGAAPAPVHGVVARTTFQRIGAIPGTSKLSCALPRAAPTLLPSPKPPYSSGRPRVVVGVHHRCRTRRRRRSTMTCGNRLTTYQSRPPPARVPPPAVQHVVAVAAAQAVVTGTPSAHHRQGRPAVSSPKPPISVSRPARPEEVVAALAVQPSWPSLSSLTVSSIAVLPSCRVEHVVALAPSACRTAAPSITHRGAQSAELTPSESCRRPPQGAVAQGSASTRSLPA